MLEENNIISWLHIFGNTVKEFRKRQGLSQEELAELCNLHRTYIGGIERGERNVGLVNVVHIAQALEIHPSELFKNLDEALLSGAQEE